MDAEGIAPAKLYYDRFKVGFPALVDPNYATGFTVVPITLFVDEHGVVRSSRRWQDRLKPKDKLAPVTDAIRAQWTNPQARLDSAEIARLLKSWEAHPKHLPVAVDLSSRYLDLGLNREAERVLKTAIAKADLKQAARGDDRTQTRLLGQICFQLARAAGKRDERVKYATLAFYLNPSIGYGKQIARIIAPEKFDNRPRGDFDNRFREGTLRRLRSEREAWLKSPE